jgi:hypothetical protein
VAEFDFENESGDLITREYGVGKAPSFVRVKGVKYERAYRSTSVAAVGRVSENLHFTARSLEPYIHKGTAHEPPCGYDHAGRARFASRAEAKKYIVEGSKYEAEKGQAHHSGGYRWTENDPD